MYPYLNTRDMIKIIWMYLIFAQFESYFKYFKWRKPKMENQFYDKYFLRILKEATIFAEDHRPKISRGITLKAKVNQQIHTIP